MRTRQTIAARFVVRHHGQRLGKSIRGSLGIAERQVRVSKPLQVFGTLLGSEAGVGAGQHQRHNDHCVLPQLLRNGQRRPAKQGRKVGGIMPMGTAVVGPRALAIAQHLRRPASALEHARRRPTLLGRRRQALEKRQGRCPILALPGNLGQRLARGAVVGRGFEHASILLASRVEIGKLHAIDGGRIEAIAHAHLDVAGRRRRGSQTARCPGQLAARFVDVDQGTQGGRVGWIRGQRRLERQLRRAHVAHLVAIPRRHDNVHRGLLVGRSRLGRDGHALGQKVGEAAELFGNPRQRRDPLRIRRILLKCGDQGQVGPPEVV